MSRGDKKNAALLFVRRALFFGSRLSKKLADHALFFLVFDAGKHFLAEPGDCFRPIEWQVIVDLASLKMARLASGLENRFYVSLKSRFFRSGQRCDIQFGDGRCDGLRDATQSDT